MPTTFNKSTLSTFFETGDVPQGADYQNLIYSQVNIAETGEQDMAGALSSTKVITPKVSATNVNITGILSANTINFTNNLIITGTITASAASITSDVSALGNVYCSGVRNPVGIVSAAGTAQATGAQLTFTINRLQGITDGQTTGFSLLANKTGWTQYILNETATSANLWPPTGGHINSLANNAAFALAGSTGYTIVHTQASAYMVK